MIVPSDVFTQLCVTFTEVSQAYAKVIAECKVNGKAEEKDLKRVLILLDNMHGVLRAIVTENPTVGEVKELPSCMKKK